MRQVVIPASLARAPALAQPAPRLQLSGETMGTTWQVTLHAAPGRAASVRAAIEATLQQVVAQMSHWDPASDLSRFNSAAADSLVTLPDPLFTLLQRARRIAAETGGAYDPTTGALVRRWGFGPDRARLEPDFRIPDAAEIDMLRRRAGWQRLQLEPDTHHAYQPGGLSLDLSAIAKGFAVDLVSARLLRDGHASHLVEIGGELRGAGVKPDVQPWWIALEPPAEGALSDETLVALCDRAVATSGDYRRNFLHDGRRFAHTIDPRSGQVVHNDLASVTVISTECWHADAMSTALLVMGLPDALPFADRHGIAARFVQRTEARHREHASRAWNDMLS